MSSNSSKENIIPTKKDTYISAGRLLIYYYRAIMQITFYCNLYMELDRLEKKVRKNREPILINYAPFLLSMGFADLSAIHWCKIFGVERNNDLHWKNVFGESVLKRGCELIGLNNESKFFKKLLSLAEVSKNKHQILCKKLVTYRDKHASHHDIFSWESWAGKESANKKLRKQNFEEWFEQAPTFKEAKDMALAFYSILENLSLSFLKKEGLNLYVFPPTCIFKDVVDAHVKEVILLIKTLYKKDVYAVKKKAVKKVNSIKNS